MRRILKLAVLFGAVATVAAGEDLSRDADHDYDPPVPGSYALPVIKSAGDGSLVDSTNKPVQLHDLTRGRISVLGFIYTRCAAPNGCPYANNVFDRIHSVTAKEKVLAENMRLVSVSFDPDHDTPGRLAEFAEALRETAAGCEWRFATARSRAELDKILNSYGQAVDKRANANDPQGPLYHILRVFLIDGEGRIRNIYSSGTLDARLVIADVKTLLLERSKVSKQ